MSKKAFARAAHLTRKVAEWLIPVFTAIKLLIELASKVANCNDRELQVPVSVAG
jgi:hypothetical protein